MWPQVVHSTAEVQIWSKIFIKEQTARLIVL
jgi:hypothetical protein